MQTQKSIFRIKKIVGKDANKRDILKQRCPHLHYHVKEDNSGLEEEEEFSSRQVFVLSSSSTGGFKHQTLDKG